MVTNQARLKLYQKDVYFEKNLPSAVIQPNSISELIAIVRECFKSNLSVVIRGAGTSYTGGATPSKDSIVILTTKLNKVYEINIEEEYAIVEPGMVNAELNNILEKYGYHFCPDPISRAVCTVGGNVSQNAGGPNCLYYGVTYDHILGMEVILTNGEIIKVGNIPGSDTNMNLKSLFIGSEGTLGVITKIWVKIVKISTYKQGIKLVCPTTEIATNIVNKLINEGIKPHILEMLAAPALPGSTNIVKDKEIYPTLLISFESESEPELGKKINRFKKVMALFPVEIIPFSDNLMEVRSRLLSSRLKLLRETIPLKSKQYLVDAVVPRSKLLNILNHIEEIALKYQVVILNTFHAGDGNIHPSILYDDSLEERDYLKKITDEILSYCVKLGGSIAAEHGIGLEKRRNLKLMYNENEIRLLRKFKSIFDPNNLLNSDKIFDLEE
ncbi:FAD-binding oxidoreductase [Bacillus pseudomycoides]|uniref:FAD-binding oxidoreductase n=1 Tax=Bacillus pseudomycoides TaxID=64104 RepID=UPI001FB4B28E|nr:FAD-linked oxidase C-terminal domain-containing protein [Bacillus pseudomycoides]